MYYNSDENRVRRSLRSRSNSRVDRPNYKEYSTDSDLESCIKQLPIIPNNGEHVVATSQDISESIRIQEVGQV